MPMVKTDAFYGHLLDGTFILSLATLWAFRAWRRYAIDRLRNAKHAGPSAHVIASLQQAVWFEGVFKMVVASIGVGIQVFKGTEGDRIAHMENIQHACMYSFYIPSGILDVLSCKETLLPQGANRAVLLLAFCVEVLVFHSHLHGRPPLDTLMHGLIVYAVLAKAACLCFEMVLKDSVLAPLGTAFFGAVQGSWVLQIAFSLCSPDFGSWQENHQNLMYAVALFTWHMAGALLFLALIGVLTWLCYVGSHIPRQKIMEASHHNGSYLMPPLLSVPDAFDELLEVLPSEATDLAVCFEDTYVGRRRSNGVQTAILPPSLWSVHDTVQQDCHAQQPLSKPGIEASRPALTVVFSPLGLPEVSEG
ncbi:hypothetical protein HPB47_004908 [Ixodes persulcatus]|uniref:Uncharacterized protein n=1 Tax=Ixodes persulcatus TaxID=34615 RepID=A0AC60PFN4_IXOPE|nr:hypothetical protein HPB47_004908 [Ixodes persulcatus]